MTINSSLIYTPTNQGFTFINVGIDEISFQLKFPTLDPAESRAARVDSKVADYQFSFKINDHFRTLLYHQDYQGYYVNVDKIGIPLQDLKFSHSGGQIIYGFDPAFSMAMLEDVAWVQEHDNGSWLASLGLDQFSINGELIPKSLNETSRVLQQAQILSLSLRMGYGYNWFAGASGGVGTNISQIEAKYSNNTSNLIHAMHSSITTEGTSTWNTKLISNVSLSIGYRWAQAKVGVFARNYLWNTSSSGIYVSAIF